MSQPTPPDRDAMVRRLANTYAAIRNGRLRVVNPAPNATFRPRMEIYNDPGSPDIIATLELPGVTIADLSISIKQGNLVVQGRRRPRYPPGSQQQQHARRRSHANQTDAAGDVDMDVAAAEASQTRAHDRLFPLKELRYGAFQRSIALPDGVDTSCIKASLTEGLLTVSWPRIAPQAQAAATGAANSRVNSGASTQHPSMTVERPTSSLRGEQPSGGSRAPATSSSGDRDSRHISSQK